VSQSRPTETANATDTERDYRQQLMHIQQEMRAHSRDENVVS
jgi:hypothetical protein